MRATFKSRLQLSLAVVAFAVVAFAPSAVAGWYFADTGGAFGTVPSGYFTNSGPAGYWDTGLLDNENAHANKSFFRVRYSAGCGGTLTTVQWNSWNYGSPQYWTIPFSVGGCSYTYARNQSTGNARLRAGQFDFV